MTDRDRAYQRMFDAFVQARSLDIESDTWPPDAEAAWASEVARFNATHPAVPPNREEQH